MPVKSHPPFQLKTLDACYFQLLSYIFLETPSLSLCLNVLQITSLMPGFSCHKTYLIPKSQNMIAIFWECMFLQCLLGTVVWVWSKALCFLGNCVFFFFHWLLQMLCTTMPRIPTDLVCEIILFCSWEREVKSKTTLCVTDRQGTGVGGLATIKLSAWSFLYCKTETRDAMHFHQL